MTRKHFAIFAAAASLTFSAAAASAADRVRPGQWEFTSTTAGQTQMSAHCVKDDEAGQFNGDAKSARAHAEKLAKTCTFTEYETSGDTVSYAMTCGTMSIRTKGTYRGDTFEADLTMKSDRRPETVTHTKGRRVGDCR